MENGEEQNSPDEEELEDWEEEQERRKRKIQKLKRGRGANRKDRRIVDSIAREKGMVEEQRQQFGDYIEEVKRQEGRGGADNFTRAELLDLANEFLDN